MKYYSIPGTSLTVSSVIMGCMRISSLTPKEIELLARTAMDHGVNFFDQADIYGDGLSGCSPAPPPGQPDGAGRGRRGL